MNATKHPLIGRVASNEFTTRITNELGGGFFLAEVLDPDTHKPLKSGAAIILSILDLKGDFDFNFPSVEAMAVEYGDPVSRKSVVQLVPKKTDE